MPYLKRGVKAVLRSKLLADPTMGYPGALELTEDSAPANTSQPGVPCPLDGTFLTQQGFTALISCKRSVPPIGCTT